MRADTSHNGERSPSSSVISEIMAGDALSMSAAAKLIPSNRPGVKSNPSTLFRWVTVGHRLPSGTFCKLEAAKVAGHWVTSKAAIVRFLEKSTAAAQPQPATEAPPARSRSESRRGNPPWPPPSGLKRWARKSIPSPS